MPMLIPNHQSIPKSIESISKNGIDIDAVVRNSFSHAIKNSLSKFSKSSVQCITRGGFSKSSSGLDKTKDATKGCPPKKSTELKAKPLTARNKNCDIGKQLNNPLQVSMQAKKALLADKMIKKENRETCPAMHELDDSLTSLQWLTGVKVNDLMEGKPISYTPLSPAPSNCSDEGDDKKPNHGGLRYLPDGSVDYRTNSHVKPPYSYAALIIMAMKSKSCSKMTLSEIYRWITDNFVYYKHAEPSWQNSIRHNLSLNKCFAKIPRNKGDPGKGGYWSIVPEYADKLLESNIRKRRSSMVDYGCQDFVKRQRLDLFESQLLMKIKEEIHSPRNNTKLPDLNNKTVTTGLENNSYRYKNMYKHSSSELPTATPADAEQCRIDHPYGKNPFCKFVSEEDNIKAIADSLQRTSHSFVDPNATTSSSINFDLTNSQIFNTFASAIRTDCIWSSENHTSGHTDLLTESMSMVKEELLEARNLTGGVDDSTLLSKGLTASLNSSGGFTATFCLSPPLSGDDDTLSDDLNDDTPPFEDLNLTVRGTSMTLLHPTQEMIDAQSCDVKEEPLSPESIDLQDEGVE